MKIFVQERLATICLLSNKETKCLNYSPFEIGASTTPFNQFYHEAVLSDALKRAYGHTMNAAYLNEFSTLRENIIQKLKHTNEAIL
jgi:vesicle coat complex subunit